MTDGYGITSAVSGTPPDVTCLIDEFTARPPA
jgi:hypothetical protein